MRSAPRPAADRLGVQDWTGRRAAWRCPDRGSWPATSALGPDHPRLGRLGPGAVLAALEAFEGPLGLAAKAPLGLCHSAGGAVRGPLAAGLLVRRVERPQPDRDRPQMAVQQHALAVATGAGLPPAATADRTWTR